MSGVVVTGIEVFPRYRPCLWVYDLAFPSAPINWLFAYDFPRFLVDDIFFTDLDGECLLAHAEVGEDFAEDVVGGDFAGDFAEVVDCFADVLAHEVAADALL